MNRNVNTMRLTMLALLMAPMGPMALGGCGSATADGPATTPRLWVEANTPLPRDAQAFAMGARADQVLVTPLGTWNEPLDVEGVVLSSGRRRIDGPIRVRTPRWRAQHELALRVGDERVLVQYDAPADQAPVEPGELVQVMAHSMSDGPRLAFSLAVMGPAGDARLIGVRSSDPGAALLPQGWSVEGEQALRWACGGSQGPAPGVRVRGPGGEIIAEPGRTAVAALGADGARYAVDLVIERTPHVACGADAGQLSVVVRRLGDRPPPTIEAGSRASL